MSSLLDQLMALRAAAQAELDALTPRDAALRRTLADLDASINRLQRVEPHTSVTTGVPALPAPSKSIKRHRAPNTVGNTPPRVVTEKAVEILREQGTMTAQDLLPLLRAAGCTIEGKNAVQVMQTALWNSPDRIDRVLVMSPGETRVGRRTLYSAKAANV